MRVEYLTDADGHNTTKCHTNKYGIMPYVAHGGSYPGAWFNTAGNTVTGE